MRLSVNSEMLISICFQNDINICYDLWLWENTNKMKDHKYFTHSIFNLNLYFNKKNSFYLMVKINGHNFKPYPDFSPYYKKVFKWISSGGWSFRIFSLIPNQSKVEKLLFTMNTLTRVHFKFFISSKIWPFL